MTAGRHRVAWGPILAVAGTFVTVLMLIARVMDTLAPGSLVALRLPAARTA